MRLAHVLRLQKSSQRCRGARDLKTSAVCPCPTEAESVCCTLAKSLALCLVFQIDGCVYDSEWTVNRRLIQFRSAAHIPTHMSEFLRAPGAEVV